MTTVRRHMNSAAAHYLKPGKTNTWITPREITALLGPFDTDPCAALGRRWSHAYINYDEEMDGLRQEWYGRVWLNPPYSHGLIRQFTKRFIAHGNGIALVFPRVDTRWFQELGEAADAMLLPPGRIRFCRIDGSSPAGAALGNVFFAIGQDNVSALRRLKGLLYGKIRSNYNESKSSSS